MKSSIQRELDDFFGRVQGTDFSIHQVTKSAFTQARKKLRHEVFIEISKTSVSFFYKNTAYKLWDKHRLLACDGSTVMLPNSKNIQTEFKPKVFGPKADSVRSIAKISLFYDVLNLVTLNAQIDSFEVHETTLFKKQLTEVEFFKNDILLLDRGYPSIGLLYELQHRHISFCVRLKDNWWNVVNTMLSDGETDKIVTLTLPPKDKELQKKFKAKSDNIQVRLVVIELETGEKEILCTSLLDAQKYTLVDLNQLYHLRWGIEEAYKLFKVRTDLDSFSGFSALSVKQDFFATILAMNLCAILSFPIEEKVREESSAEKYKFVKTVNKTNSIALITESVVGIFIKKKIRNFVETLDKILLKSTEFIRPNRRFPRNHKVKKPKSMNYKQM